MSTQLPRFGNRSSGLYGYRASEKERREAMRTVTVVLVLATTLSGCGVVAEVATDSALGQTVVEMPNSPPSFDEVKPLVCIVRGIELVSYEPSVTAMYRARLHVLEALHDRFDEVEIGEVPEGWFEEHLAEAKKYAPSRNMRLKIVGVEGRDLGQYPLLDVKEKERKIVVRGPKGFKQHVWVYVKPAPKN